jgi:hypothetical protein
VREYTKDDHARWRELFRTDFSGQTKRAAAALIAQREGLPDKAIESIRKIL